MLPGQCGPHYASETFGLVCIDLFSGIIRIFSERDNIAPVFLNQSPDRVAVQKRGAYLDFHGNFLPQGFSIIVHPIQRHFFQRKCFDAVSPAVIIQVILSFIFVRKIKRNIFQIIKSEYSFAGGCRTAEKCLSLCPPFQHILQFFGNIPFAPVTENKIKGQALGSQFHIKQRTLSHRSCVGIQPNAMTDLRRFSILTPGIHDGDASHNPADIAQTGPAPEFHIASFSTKRCSEVPPKHSPNCRTGQAVTVLSVQKDFEIGMFCVFNLCAKEERGFRYQFSANQSLRCHGDGNRGRVQLPICLAPERFVSQDALGDCQPAGRVFGFQVKYLPDIFAEFPPLITWKRFCFFQEQLPDAFSFADIPQMMVLFALMVKGKLGNRIFSDSQRAYRISENSEFFRLTGCSHHIGDCVGYIFSISLASIRFTHYMGRLASFAVLFAI